MASHVVTADEYASGDTRGAHLHLAQRHHKIVAGQFHGRKKLEPEVPHPGATGQLALSFKTSATLLKESRITCVLPDHGWGFPTAINAVVQLPQGIPTATLKATYDPSTTTLEITVLNEEIPANVPIVMLFSGVSTPASAMPTAEVTVTSYEKLVIRNTVPPSSRGGQILDGPSIFTVPAIVPGEITGPKRWQPFSCCPGAVSDVTLSFRIRGRIPLNGKVLVELPAEGWDMPDSPRVLLRTSTYHNDLVAAEWWREQHTLQIQLGARSIGNDTSVIFTVCQVTNPSKETINVVGDTTSSARVTTLLSSGGVIDGPTKIDVASISELKESDFEHAKTAFDEVCGDSHTTVEVSKIPDLLQRTGITLSADLFAALVVPILPAHLTADNTATSTSEAPVEQIPPQGINRSEFLNVFAQIYAPAYKFGQDLRLACGRGETDLIRSLICRGCDPNAKDGSGWSALHYAADFGHVASIDAIIEALAVVKEHSSTSLKTPVELNVNIQDVSGWTPLICAGANGHVDVVDKLLSLGADISITNAEGRTALHWAATRGMDTCVTTLIAAGGAKDTQDRCGWTAFHFATIHGCESTAKTLVDAGVNVEIKDHLNYPAAIHTLTS